MAKIPVNKPSSIHPLLKATIVFIILILALSACSPGVAPSQPNQQDTGSQPNVESAASTSTSVPTLTETPLPSPTFTVSPSPAPTETPTPTPAVQFAAPISKENITQLAVLAQIGRGNLLNLAWSPDNTTLAVGVGTGLYLFDGKTLEQKNFIQSGYSYKIAWSPDRATIATGYDEDIPLAIWDIATGNPVFSIPFTYGRVQDITFNATGQLLVASNQSTGNGNSYKITTYLNTYDAKYGQLVSSYPLVNPEIKTMPLMPYYCDNGKKVQTVVVTTNTDTDVIWWDAANGRQLYKQSLSMQNIFPIPTYGDLAAIRMNNSSKVQLVDLKTGEEVKSINLTGEALAASISPEGVLRILTQGKIVSYDLNTITQNDSISVANGLAPGIYPSDYSLGAIVSDSSLSIQDISSGETLATLDGFYDVPRNPMVSSDGTTLLTVSGYASYEGFHLNLWDMNTLTLRATANDNTIGGDLLVMPLPDNRFLIAKQSESGLKTIDSLTGKAGEKLELTSDLIYSMGISQDGSTIMLNNVVYDLASRKKLTSFSTMNLPSSWTTKLSADGSRSMFQDGDILSVYDVVTGKEIFTHQEDMLKSVFSPTGDRVGFSTYGTTHSFQLYDVDNGTVLLKQILADYFLAAAFNPDGSLLVVGANNDGTYFIDAVTGEILHKLDYESTGISFEDPNLIITTSSDGAIRFWGIPVQ